ncbi:MAG TPA: aminotransferase class I/II-fold pyridoxal phosphate-dependent enzyme [Stellaceae bacterium]|nr:aminotransferase class I/II-fold pyridoxal phosphate-dependent enzyme [Stellaceae bacterium]
MKATTDKLLDDVRASVTAYCRAHHDFSFKPEKPVVRLHEPTFSGEEINAALECMLTTHVTMGAKVKTFERQFADKYGFKHGIMVNSGSSANLLAIAALANPQTKDSLKPGDEVIVPALSWSTTVWPLVQSGLVPVIVDIDPKTLNIDPGEIERAIGPKTRAVMIVPVYGNPCDMDAITDICRRRSLTLIEDCCEALGAAYDGKPLGKFGRVGTFSFYYSHHMTTLEGGICVTDDFDYAETMRILRAHGWIREVEDKARWTRQFPEIHERFLFVNLGYNLRATELQGAMGSVQLPKLDGYIKRRRENAASLRRSLAQYGEVLDFQEETPKGFHTWFGFAVTVRPDAPFKTSELTAALEAAHIETRPIICGNIARQPAMKLFPHRVEGDLKHASAVMDRSFSFGIHQDVDVAARDYIAAQFRAFLKSRGVV